MNRAGSTRGAVALVFVSSLAGSLLWYADPERWDLVFWCWATGVASFLWLAREADREAGIGRERGAVRWTPGEALLVAALLFVALGFRLHDVWELPGRLHNDEMSCGIEARKFLSEPRPALFQTGWFSCPNFGFFLTALPMFIAGPTLEALRSAGALMSLVSLIGTYLLMRETLGVRAAMILLALNATHPWAVHLGRTGLIYIQAPAAAVFTLYFFHRALRRCTWFHAAAAGIVLGVGLQTYFSIRLVPFVLLAMAVLWACGETPVAWRKLAAPMGVMAAGTLVAALPLIANYTNYPNLFNTRTTDVFVFSEKNRQVAIDEFGTAEPVAVLTNQLARSLRFFYPGKDTSVQFGFESPFVPAPLWIPYLGGLLLAATKIRWGLPFPRQDLGLSTFLVWILMAFVAGAVLTIDPPFSPRLSVMQPVFLFPAAAALAWLWSLAPASSPPGRLARSAIVILLLVTAVWNARDYFGTYRVVAVGGRRDVIGRVVEQYPFVQGVLNLCPEEEDFNYQSYQFMAPGRHFVNGAGKDALMDLIRAKDSTPWIWLVTAPVGSHFDAEGPVSLIASGRYEPRVSDPGRFSFQYWIVAPRSTR